MIDAIGIIIGVDMYDEGNIPSIYDIITELGIQVVTESDLDNIIIE